MTEQEIAEMQEVNEYNFQVLQIVLQYLFKNGLVEDSDIDDKDLPLKGPHRHSSMFMKG